MSSEAENPASNPVPPSTDDAALNAMRGALDRLSLALDTAEMGAWDWDVGLRAIFWDKQMQTLFGLPADSFAGSQDEFLELIHEDDRARIAADMQAAVADGQPYDGEFRARRHADGNLRVIRARAKAHRQDSEQTTHVIGVCWDVTERRETEEKLLAQTRLFNTLMESLPDHIYFKDLESRFVAVNRAQAENVGLTDPVEVIGKSDADFFAPEHAQSALEDERKVIATGQPLVGMEEKETWPDGNVTYCSTSKLPWRDESGRVIGTFGLSRDITRRKHMEDELARTAEELRAKNEALEEDLEMARELQSALLPQHYPSYPHGVSSAESAVHFYHFFRPSTTVSGDFFDTLDIDDDHAGLFICDVMGHGVRAALVAAIVRTLVNELRDVWDDPGVFLTRLNRAWRRSFRGTSIPLFASAFYVVADLADGELRYANAGHPRPLRLRDCDTRHVTQPTVLNGHKPGPALGLFDEMVYRTGRSDLSSHDVLLLFTDGLFEVEGNDGEFYDYPRLLSAVQQRSDLAPARLCQEVVQEVQQFSAVKQFTDDVCLVAMEIGRVSGE